MAKQLSSNRDFYKSIGVLTKEKNTENCVDLETFLKSLLVRSLEFRERQSLTLNEFFTLLEASFEPSPSLDLSPPSDDDEKSGFEGWKSLIERQIKDLQDMRRNKSLFSELAYFGIDAPSGQRWYNFNPLNFLECATVGTLGGWEEGDDTGRIYVPGEVAVMNDKGEIEGRDPRSIEEPTVEIQSLTWDDLKDFLWNGQCYE